MNFRFLNIPVTVQPTFWLFVIFFCYDSYSSPGHMLLLATTLGFSLLFHEYGHGLAAKKFGKDPEITLEAFGGYASYTSGALTDTQHFIITLCGPVFTGLLIAISYYLLEVHLFGSYWPNCFLYYMMKLNIYWLFVNLAPLKPLDGGQMMSYLLNRFLGAEKGNFYSLILGNVTGLLLTSYFLYYEDYIFALIFASYGIKNFQAYQSHPSHPSKRHGSAFDQLKEATQLLDEKELAKAELIFKKLVRSKDEYFKIHASQGLASIFEQQGKNKEAYNLLISIDPSKLLQGKWLLSKLAYREQNYLLVTTLALDVYNTHPTFETALLNAKAFAKIGDDHLAVGWLNTAMQFDEAKSDINEILADPAFNRNISERIEKANLQLNTPVRIT